MLKERTRVGDESPIPKSPSVSDALPYISEAVPFLSPGSLSMISPGRRQQYKASFEQRARDYERGLGKISVL